MNPLITEDLYQTYLGHLLAGRRNACAQIVQRLLDQDVEIRDLYSDLYRRSLYDVGTLWECNKVSLAVEHLATSITEGLLNLSYPKLFAAPRRNRRAVVACVVNEYHQLGAKMVADLMELHGWDTDFVGANTPHDVLIDFVAERKPHVLALSISIYDNLPDLLALLRKIRFALPGLEIWTGGQAFLHGGKDQVEAFPNVVCLDGLADLERRLAS
jgi:MerR family transcriptional regulator, light-induced transcriptional regulator